MMCSLAPNYLLETPNAKRLGGLDGGGDGDDIDRRLMEWMR